jgi:hypothetical protein
MLAHRASEVASKNGGPTPSSKSSTATGSGLELVVGIAAAQGRLHGALGKAAL